MASCNSCCSAQVNLHKTTVAVLLLPGIHSCCQTDSARKAATVHVFLHGGNTFKWTRTQYTVKDPFSVHVWFVLSGAHEPPSAAHALLVLYWLYCNAGIMNPLLYISHSSSRFQLKTNSSSTKVTLALIRITIRIRVRITTCIQVTVLCVTVLCVTVLCVIVQMALFCGRLRRSG